PIVLVPAARMHRKPLELEENLHVMSVSVACSILLRWMCGALSVDALDLYIAVGVELGVLPVSAIELDGRQRLQRRLLDSLESATPPANSRISSVTTAMPAGG
ncbi:MAG: hypothetical protein ACREUG_13415, partial [Steroidobacteraceae bacterium]